MKKPAGAVQIPVFNPALGDLRCLITPGQAARFCQLTLQSLGSRLPRFTREKALPASFVARLLAEKERLSWENKPWERYYQQLTHTLGQLGYPSTVLWLSYEGVEPDPQAEAWWLRLPPGKARRFANVEKAYKAALTLKNG